MDMNNFADLSPDRNEQELHSYTKWLAVFGVLFGPLLTILGLKYQSLDVSLFDIHGALMLLLIIDVCIFTISMAVTLLPTFNRTHLPFFKGVLLIFGVFAYDLILLMLVPPFEWFIFTICAFVMVLLLYRSRRQILNAVKKFLSQSGTPLLRQSTVYVIGFDRVYNQSNAVKKFLNQCGTPLLRHSTVYVIGFDRVSNQPGRHLPKHPMNPQCLFPT